MRHLRHSAQQIGIGCMTLAGLIGSVRNASADVDVGQSWTDCTGCAAAGDDANMNGVNDACEGPLVQSFAPNIIFATSEPSSGRRPYWAIAIDPDGKPSVIRIFYAMSYFADTGTIGNSLTMRDGVQSHIGDSEFFAFDVQWTSGTDWRLLRGYLSEHFGSGVIADSSGWHDASEFVLNDGVPNIYVALSKHGNYANSQGCQATPFSFIVQDKCPSTLPCGSNTYCTPAASPVSFLSLDEFDGRNLGSSLVPIPEGVPAMPNGGDCLGSGACNHEWYWQNQRFCGWQKPDSFARATTAIDNGGCTPATATYQIELTTLGFTKQSDPCVAFEACTCAIATSPDCDADNLQDVQAIMEEYIAEYGEELELPECAALQAQFGCPNLGAPGPTCSSSDAGDEDEDSTTSDDASDEEEDASDGGDATVPSGLPAPPSTVGIATGDPHLLTFTLYRYDNQFCGEATLCASTSGDLEVQIRTHRLGSENVAVIIGVAVQVRGDSVVFLLSGETLLNGASTTFPEGMTTLPGGGAVWNTLGAYAIVWPDNTQVRLTLDGFFMAVNVFLADDRLGQVVGLLGNAVTDASTQLALRDGAAFPMPASFVNFHQIFDQSWLLANTTSYFPYAPDGESTQSPAISPPDCPNGLETYDSLDAGEIEAGTLVCEAAGVPVDWVQSCVLDVVASGNPDAALAFVDAPPAPMSLDIEAPIQVINEVENNIQGKWTWNGTGYNANWTNGAAAVISVANFTSTSVTFNRTDTSVSASAGLTAVYTGTISPADGGPAGNVVNGSVTWTWPGVAGFPANGTWSATWQ